MKIPGKKNHKIMNNIMIEISSHLEMKPKKFKL